jgi:DNA-binding MarR family transcriptional regulator
MSNMYETIGIVKYICQDRGYADVVDVTAIETRRLALALYDLSWRLQRLGPARLSLEPLPTSEVAVLRAVLEHPGRGVSDVATSVAMQPSNVSAALRSLVARDLVEKRPDPRDKRMALLYPTAKSLGHRAAIEDELSSSVAEVLTALSDEQVSALLRAVPAMRALNDAVANFDR